MNTTQFKDIQKSWTHEEYLEVKASFFDRLQRHQHHDLYVHAQIGDTWLYLPMHDYTLETKVMEFEHDEDDFDEDYEPSTYNLFKIAAMNRKGEPEPENNLISLLDYQVVGASRQRSSSTSEVYTMYIVDDTALKDAGDFSVYQYDFIFEGIR